MCYNISMLYFALLMNILFLLTLIFYAIFFVLTYYWHEWRFTYIAVPIIYAFEFFVIGFFVIIAASLLIEYLPQLFKLF